MYEHDRSEDSLSIRDATEQDSDSIALIHVQAWQEAYAHLLPGSYLQGFEREEGSSRSLERGGVALLEWRYRRVF
ncbi:hypothetical protein ACYU03_13960 [Pseudomonas sp. X10]